MSRFEQCLAITLRHEGGWSDHPADPGGATMKGITIGVYRQWKGRAVSKDDLRAISDDEVRTIYRRNYWDKVRGDDLPPGVDLVAFDGAVNSGPATSARWLQAALGVTADGKIGPITLAEARGVNDRPGAITRATNNRMAALQRMRGWPTFGRGWTNRVADVRRSALAMAGSPVLAPATTNPVVVGGAPSQLSQPASPVLRQGAKGAAVVELQSLLNRAGASPALVVDGDFGARTSGAVLAFQRGRGLTADGIVGPQTWAALRGVQAAPAAPAPATGGLPWLAAGMEPYGWHEVRDNARLRAWLLSDGRTLGDPKAQPWCGDYAETAIRLGLPNEPFPGALGQNPYWARNWALFGRPTAPTFGCVGVWSRGSGGHVGFIIGHDASAWHVLGGNQGDRVSVTRISKTARELLATRWPATFPARPINLPTRSAGNLTLSTNEV